MSSTDDPGGAAPSHAGRVRAGRLAVYAAFLANGFFIGSWAPKIPVFAARLSLTEETLGLLIVILGLGALAALAAGAWLTTHFGSHRVVRWTSLLLAPLFVPLTLAPDAASAALVLALLGALVGGMDGAMNANAVAVETAMRRPIMSSCHGFWSLGGLVGAGLGGMAIETAGALGHAVLVSAAAFALMIPAQRHLLEADGPSAEAPGMRAVRLPRSAGIYLIGAATLASMVPEGSVLDWSALYLDRELGADVALAGFAYAAFSGTMALMRFGGDAMRARLGDRMAFGLSCVTAAAGLGIAGTAPGAVVAVCGFLVSGLGMANLVPILFSAAGRFPGVPPAVGIAIATALGYSGLLFAPASIGFIAAGTGFAAVYAGFAVLLPVAGLLVLSLLAPRS